jgi:phosphate transport system permease protein
MRIRFDRPTRRRWKSALVSIAAFACVVIALVPLGSILFEAASRGLGAFSTGFFTQPPPEPCSSQFSNACPTGGIANAIQGTLILVGIAALISIPIGALTGIYVSEFGNNRFGRAVRFFTEIMTEIPSIVVGVFVYSLMLALAVSGLMDRRSVFSTLSGTFALAVIMIPIVARTTEDALRMVPTSIREAALALGIPKYRVVLRVVLSTARSGLITGSLLSVARAGGETAPLIMTAFGSPFGFQGLNQPVEALPHLIYVYGTSAYQNWQQLAWGASLVLVMMMLAISVASRLALRNRFGSSGVRH